MTTLPKSFDFSRVGRLTGFTLVNLDLTSNRCWIALEAVLREYRQYLTTFMDINKRFTLMVKPRVNQDMCLIYEPNCFF